MNVLRTPRLANPGGTHPGAPRKRGAIRPAAVVGARVFLGMLLAIATVLIPARTWSQDTADSGAAGESVGQGAATTTPDAASEHLRQGRLHARELIAAQQARKALDDVLLPLIAQHPEDPFLALLSGEAHFALEDWAAAVREFERGFAVAPDLMGRTFNYGRACLKMRAMAAAERAFVAMQEEADLGLQSKGALGRGLLRAEQGRDLDAIPFFRDALQLNALEHRARYQLGLSAQRAGRLEEAARSFEAVYAARPLHHGAAYNLSLVLARLGRHEESADARVRHRELMAAKKKISVLKEQLRAGAQTPELFLALADQYTSVGAFSEAIQSCRRALTLRQEPDVALRLAKAFERGEKLKDAAQVYRQVLRFPGLDESTKRTAVTSLLWILDQLGGGTEASRLRATYAALLEPETPGGSEKK